MRVGILSDLRNPAGWRTRWHDHYQYKLDLYVEAERLGIDTVWLTEHHFVEDGHMPQPIAFAAAVAARTSTIGIGTATALAPNKHPVHLAEETALVDVISGGRFQLGLGAGYVVPDLTRFGVDFAKRFTLLEEHAREVRRLLDERLVTPGPVQEHLPIWMCVTGPKGSRMAGRLGEGLGWLDPAQLEPYRQGLIEGGHSPDAAKVTGLAQLIISEDPERDWARITKHLTYLFGAYAAAAMEDTDAIQQPNISATAQDLDPSAMRSPGPVMVPPAFDVVTPDEAVQRLRTWLEPMPVAEVYFWESVAGMPRELVHSHLELLASKVAPSIRGIGLQPTLA
jgi:alkanesulfonate monooxygenase SsuD/methylene tetrahydromethanopterin reductase-like flavin-dependent oxidoreductase (luciferase family)